MRYFCRIEKIPRNSCSYAVFEGAVGDSEWMHPRLKGLECTLSCRPRDPDWYESHEVFVGLLRDKVLFLLVSRTIRWTNVLVVSEFVRVPYIYEYACHL
jgi:hypothetical protein